MSSVHKEHIKAIKGPDQFQVRIMAGMNWAMRNVRLLIFIVAPVVAVLVGVLAVQLVQSKLKDGRLAELGKIQLIYDAESRQVSDARQALMKKIEELDKKAAPAAAGADPAKPAPALDPKIDAEKQSLQKQAEALKADHGPSRQRFEAYFKANAGHAEGWMAGTQAAGIAIEQEKYAEAKALLQDVLGHAKSMPFYQTQLRLALISTLEELGEYDQELAEIDSLDKSNDKSTAELKPRILLARGRAQMLKGASADAKTTFAALIEAHASTPEAQKARSYSALIN